LGTQNQETGNDNQKNSSPCKDVRRFLEQHIIPKAGENQVGIIESPEMGFNQGEAQVVFHAEAYSLIRAYEKTGGNLPAQMKLYVDRQTCGPCKQYLPELMHEMKIDIISLVMKNGEKVTVNSRAR
jgi:hypothetical protein